MYFRPTTPQSFSWEVFLLNIRWVICLYLRGLQLSNAYKFFVDCFLFCYLNPFANLPLVHMSHTVQYYTNLISSPHHPSQSSACYVWIWPYLLVVLLLSCGCMSDFFLVMVIQFFLIVASLACDENHMCSHPSTSDGMATAGKIEEKLASWILCDWQNQTFCI